MTKTNQLANEVSPYLLQHAHNPVDWHPWNQETLAKAKQENKPILLSIGYAACHWCHVMAHESFEDEATAKLMNEFFINIKVDREERPDLDKIYQTAHYLLTQQTGGWPLTIFLNPDDLTPFFSGTYFPKEPHFQLPAFKEVLKALADIYKNKFQEIKQQNVQLKSILNVEKKTTPTTLTDEPLKQIHDLLLRRWDTQHGGLLGAPKFPHPTILELLIHEKSSLASDTLDAMARGGIYDQLQGGFFRYSVDERWDIPHFEKMLYDNGQLLYLYALASQQFSNSYFATIARETANWVITVMKSSEGGFFSSLDADSEGHEGKFYIWKKTEVQAILTKKEFQFAELYFNLSQFSNFEHQWHLHVISSLDSIATELKISFSEAQQLLDTIKTKLLTEREKRVPPAKDTKILTSWNALMIKGMALASDILHEPRYLASAEQSLQLIQQKLMRNNRLLASYKDSKAHLDAYLDDYAFLLDAILSVLQVSWNTEHLKFAIQLADNLLEHFFDPENGGFFFTANDHEKILYRPKTMLDEAIPSGNAIAARALLVLGHLLGETRYLTAAEKTLQAAFPALHQFPAEHCGLLLALELFLKPANIIIIRGKEAEMKRWQAVCKNRNRIRNIVFAIPDTETELPALIATRKPHTETVAYVCQGTNCLPVITDFESLNKLFS